MKKLKLPNEIDPNHKGSTLYVENSGQFYAALRIEISSNVAFSMDEYYDFHSKALPYIPNSESSVYLKTPPGAIYETNFAAVRFGANNKVTINHAEKMAEKIYDPYVSWHGGMNPTNSQGVISLRGYIAGGHRTRYSFNQTQAIAKDSLAGNYNPIAQVILPRIMSSLPPPVTTEWLVSPRQLPKYNDQKFGMSKMMTDRIDLVIDSAAVTKKGMTVVVLVHNPSPLHKSRFAVEQRAKWLIEPVTLFPNHKAPLACSLLFVETDVEMVLDDAPIIFIGCSTQPDQNLAFSAFKIK